MSSIKPWLLASALAVSVVTAGCGGGGGSDAGTAPPAGSEVPPGFKVAGPLDTVQTPLTTSVFTPLSDALAGTPLQGVVTDAGQIVAGDVLDIVDALTSALQQAGSGNPQAALTASVENVRGSIVQLARHLQELVTSLAAGAGGNSAPGASNPLAGTPLAAFGGAVSPAAASTLLQLDTPEGADLQLSQLAQVFALLNQQLQSGLAQVPAQAADAPVLGGVLTTLSEALNDVSGLLNAAGAYNGAATAAALQNTLDHTLDNLLTRVVPLEFAEQQGGQSGTLTGPIRDAVAQLSTAFGDSVGMVTTPVLEDLLAGALSPLLNPVENGVLPLLLEPIIEALGSGTPGTGGSGDVFAGTPLAGLFEMLSSALLPALAPILEPLNPILQPLCVLPIPLICSGQ